jgi:glycosyltransferase involved in cell wall biosynthesis
MVVFRRWKVIEPDASVVIPTRDRHHRLELALRSALAQRDVSYEILVVDDGSTDGTEGLKNRISDPRVRWLRRAAPSGVSAARNVGISAARGRWIAFLDDDDVWAPTKLAQQLNVMRTSRRTWSYVGTVIVDGDLHVVAGAPPPPPDEVVRMLERHNAVPGSASSVMVRTDVLAAAGPFDEGLTSSEDWDMWIRLGRAGRPDWVCQPLVALSYHGSNASLDTEGMLRQLSIVAERYGITFDRARHQRWAAWQAMLDGRRVDAVRAYGGAVRAGDIGSLGRAIIAAVYPGYATRRMRSGRRPEHAAWIRDASAWLAPLTVNESSRQGRR